MEFTVIERLALLPILPIEGSFITLKLLRKLKEELSFSEREHEILGLKTEDGVAKWRVDVQEDGVKRIKIGEVMKNVVKDALQKLDGQEKLREVHMSLYEKFVV